MPGHLGAVSHAVSLKKILSFCNIVKGQAIYRIIHYIKCNMPSKSSIMGAGFCSLYREIHYIEVRCIKV